MFDAFRRYDCASLLCSCASAIIKAVPDLVRTLNFCTLCTQMLLKCTHDALEANGLDRIGELFGAPVVVDEDDSGDLSVHGQLCHGNPVLHIDEADVRARYMRAAAAEIAQYSHGLPSNDSGSGSESHSDAGGGESWSYPAPDDSDDASPDAADAVQGGEPPSAEMRLTAAAAAAAPMLSHAAAAADGADAALGPPLAPTGVDLTPSRSSIDDDGARGALPGMHRVASWNNDKFTAMPTRTHFPQLSEINHLLDEEAVAAAGGAAAVAPGVGSLEPDTARTAPHAPILANDAGSPPDSALLASRDEESGSDGGGAAGGVDASPLQSQPALVIEASASEPLLLHRGDSGSLGRSPPSCTESGSLTRSPSRSPTVRRHVFSAPAALAAAADGDAAGLHGGELAAAAAIALGVGGAGPADATNRAEDGSDAVAAPVWVQPCVGSLDAAEALVGDPAEALSQISSGVGGWRETLESPKAAAAGGAAAAPLAGASERSGAALRNGVVHCSDAAEVRQRDRDRGHTAERDTAAERSEAAAMARAPAGDDAHVAHECLTAPPSRGILVRHDDGTRQATKQVVLERTPPVLLLHLNRFESAWKGARKRSAHVAFPFQLFIHPHIAAPPQPAQHAASPSSEAVRYRLKAVLVHGGHRVDRGHYICFVWRPTAMVQAAARVLRWVPPGPTAPISIPAHTIGARRHGDGGGGGGSGARGASAGGRAPHMKSRFGQSRASSSASPSTAHASRLSHGHGELFARQESASEASEAGSARTSLDGAWRAVAAGVPAARSPGRARLWAGGSSSGGGSRCDGGSGALESGSFGRQVSGLSGGGASDAADAADSVDWEELADNPGALQSGRLSSCGGAELASREASGRVGVGSLPAAQRAQAPGVGAHVRKGRAAAGHPAVYGDSDARDTSVAVGTDVDADVDVKDDEDAGEVPPVGELLARERQDDLGVWIKCADETVSTVSWRTVARAQAYMLLYEQV